MKSALKSFILAGTMLWSATGISAQSLISGKVTDNKGVPVAGAYILEKGTATGTVSNENGTYELNVGDTDSSVLVFSCLSYREHEEAVAGRSVINAVLEEDSQMLDDVIIVGYGTQKKSNLTGSLISIDFENQMAGKPVLSISSSLAGMAAGLSAIQTSGQPGNDAATMRIRGNNSITSSANSPLVLVDGIEWNMTNINSNDVASITVLKDAASTAIYGTRAANGIILITTKKGQEGKASISYSFSGIVQKAHTNGLEFVSDYAQHMGLINEGCDNVGSPRIFSDGSISQWEYAKAHPNEFTEAGVPLDVAYPNTNWFDEIFMTGFSHEHNVSVSGASKTINYYISLGYLNNEGVMNRFNIDSGYEKISARVNIEADVTKWFRLGAKIFGLQQSYGLADIASGFKYLNTSPGIYPGSPNAWGHPSCPEELQNANNILQHMSGKDGYDKRWRLNGTVFAIFKPFKGFSIEGTFNYSPNFTEKDVYSIKNGKWDYINDVQLTYSNLENATNSFSYSRSWSQSAELLVRYNTDIEKHHIGVLAGYSAIEYRNRGYKGSRHGGTDWSLNSEMSTFSEVDNATSTALAGWGLRSYFARFNYSFNDKYLFEANFRADGSSRFGNKNRYGYFPSFSAGWAIGKEPWMSDSKEWLSNLKVRISWGQTGNNQGIGNYEWQALYSQNKLTLNGNLVTGLYTSSLSNSDLKWETTSTADFGIDFGFFDNRLSGEIDTYYKNTSGILYKPAIYLSMGFVDAVPSNLGTVSNSGIELTLNWKDRIGKFFDYFVGFNYSFNRNMVTKFKGKYETYQDGSNNLSNVSEGWETAPGRLCEGHMLGEHYRYSIYKGTGKGYTGGDVDINAGPVDGIIRTEKDMEWVQCMMDSGYTFSGLDRTSKDQFWYGDIIYSDLNGNGDYGDSNDQNWTGYSSTPKHNIGINLGFSCKGADFSMTWTGSFGFKLNWIASGYNTSTVKNGTSVGTMVANDHYFFDPEKPEDSRTNIDGAFPRLTYGVDLNNSLRSDFYEYNGNFLKLKSIQIGYTFPDKWMKKIYVQNLRLFCSAENLLTITKYPGLDPETGTSIGYPLMRQFSFGAQIRF